MEVTIGNATIPLGSVGLGLKQLDLEFYYHMARIQKWNCLSQIHSLMMLFMACCLCCRWAEAQLKMMSHFFHDLVNFMENKKAGNLPPNSLWVLDHTPRGDAPYRSSVWHSSLGPITKKQKFLNCSTSSWKHQITMILIVSHHWLVWNKFTQLLLFLNLKKNHARSLETDSEHCEIQRWASLCVIKILLTKALLMNGVSISASEISEADRFSIWPCPVLFDRRALALWSFSVTFMIIIHPHLSQNISLNGICSQSQYITKTKDGLTGPG